MKRHSTAPALLNDLLDRFEAGAESSRPRGYLGAFPNVSAEDECVAQLELVERQGGIVLSRRRVDGVGHIANVRLSDAGVVYRYLGRASASSSAANSIDALRSQIEMTPGLEALLAEVEGTWSRNVRWSGLKPGRARSLGNALTLARAAVLFGQGKSATPVDYRTFSRREVGDSKAFERLASVVAVLIRRLFATDALRGEFPDADLFASLGIERLPQPLLVSGPLAIDGRALPALDYLGLPPERHPGLSVIAPCAYVLTIENYVSFVRYVREVEHGNGIVVFTGGFPARTILRAIVHLAEQAVAPVFHWGDIDAGGLRIFLHLENTLRERGIGLRPHLMTADLLHEWGVVPSGPRRRGLAKAAATGSAIAVLWDHLAEEPSGLVLEQEAVAPSPPMLDLHN